MATFVGFCMELLRIVLFCTRPLSDRILDFLYKIFMGTTKPLPPIDDKIILLPATELANRIRKRQLKAEAVMEAYIKRIKDVEPLINACIDERFEYALSDAKEVDRFLESTDKSEDTLTEETPLLGVPFTCKESIGVKGLAMTKGLVMYKDHKAPADAETVTLLKKAGAIPVTVTNVPVHCMWWESSNQAFGMTKNPYDHARTVGGSSGGEGAIITAAGALFGIGTDLAGSIRIPSSFCGIYGHKPSRGVISNHRPWPATMDGAGTIFQYISTGPMCRYVQDLRMLLRVSCGKDAEKLKLDEKVTFTELKIYYMEEIPGFLLSSTSDTKAAVRKAVNHFSDKFGNTAIQLNLKELEHAFDIWQCKFIEADGPPIQSLQKYMKISWLWELIKWFFSRAQFDLPIILFGLCEKKSKDQHYYKCLKMYEQLKKKLEDILSGDAIILMPTHPEPAPHIFTTIPRFKNIGYTCIFNILGYPATNIPAGMSYGVPIGLQVVAAQYKDHLTVATAEELDEVFRGWQCPSEIAI